jgi:hypothetical protein
MGELKPLKANFMKSLQLAALILPAVLASACIPIKVSRTDWPAVDGMVFNVATGKPVGGAAVSVRATDSDLSASTTTANDGTFHFEQHTRAQWTPYYSNDVFPPAVISITAPGYEHFEHKLDGSMAVESIPLAPSR